MCLREGLSSVALKETDGPLKEAHIFLKPNGTPKADPWNLVEPDILKLQSGGHLMEVESSGV